MNGQIPERHGAQRAANTVAQSQVNRIKYAVVVDCGGTDLKFRGIKTDAEKVVERVNVTKPCGSDLQVFMHNLAEGITVAAGDIGVSIEELGIVLVDVPGPMDREGNAIITNVSKGRQVNMIDGLREDGIVGPIIDGYNDADAAVLGAVLHPKVLERIQKVGECIIIGITLGTGIGLAKVRITMENGEPRFTLLRGRTGAGEFHIPDFETIWHEKCGCGNRGCPETTPASPGGMVIRGINVVRKVLASPLMDEGISVIEAAAKGDEFARMLMMMGQIELRDGHRKGVPIDLEAFLETTRRRYVNAVLDSRLIRIALHNGIPDNRYHLRRLETEREKLTFDDYTKLSEIIRASLEQLAANKELKGRDIFESAQKGDVLSQMIMGEGGGLLARALISLVNAEEASIVVICGGGANALVNEGPYSTAFYNSFPGPKGVWGEGPRVMGKLQEINVIPVIVPQDDDQNLALDGLAHEAVTRLSDIESASAIETREARKRASRAFGGSGGQ